LFVCLFVKGPIQKYRIGLSSFDWNYFDNDRLVLLGGKEYFDYVIPSRSTIVIFFEFCFSKSELI